MGKENKTVIVYASVHHGNTKKVVERIAESRGICLIDAVHQQKADLTGYDRIGFASGIYFSRFHQGTAAYGSMKNILKEKHARVIGKYGCKGYDTFGPFKIVGGIAKGHPSEKDLRGAVEFMDRLSGEEKLG